ncbi:LysR family transcriptional regulator [Chitinophaga nivalis]|uniref:LysR family transcriptional regulator n=1 Tax=Chitinophaga nivalis TaxID=2991709 RepID=A0ABT3IJ89_9BACT|nr:LysR family transcriptional regulator [Chitinophaga nivalis]MCW3466282.1 LysR family transcriptional regulator [Chitinophaga nivalis]MCW3484027.1 LysR family transcriptional regulator [Chitinophaga nivalis]
MVNFEWYRTFKAIYQTGTLTGAAQELLISQPNVSQHLASLESYVRHPLFERKPRKMVPTEYGKLFYTQIIEAVEKLEGVETDFREACAKQVPMTCIGAPKEFFHAVMASRLNRVNSSLVFNFGITKQLMERLDKGELYFVLATHCPEHGKNIVHEPVLEERFLLVASPELDATVFKKAVSKGDLATAEQWLLEQDWISYSSDLPIIRRFWADNFRKRPLLKPRFIVPDYDSILKSVSSGCAIAIAADYLVRPLLKEKKLVSLWPGAHSTANTIYLAYDKTRVTTDQVSMMKQMLGI